MKKLVACMIGVTLLAGLTGCGSDSGSSTGGGDSVITLRLADTLTETYPATAGAAEFARLVSERSDGRIQITLYTGGTLGGDEQAIIEQVQFGGIDMARVNISPMAEFSPILNLLQMPFLFSGTEHMHAVIDSEIGAELLASVENSGFIGLALYEAGTRNIYNSKRPITSIEDLKGLKIRIPQNQLMIDMIEALGAVAMPLSISEVYSALQTGMIDGAENNSPSYDQMSHYEVAQYITMDAHTAPPEILIFSKNINDKLSTEDQELIKQAALDSVIYQRDVFETTEQESLDKVVAGGVEISELTDRTPFEEAVAPLYDIYAGDYADMLARIQAMK